MAPPTFSAQKYANYMLNGTDGKEYISKPDKKGKFHWQPYRVVLTTNNHAQHIKKKTESKTKPQKAKQKHHKKQIILHPFTQQHIAPYVAPATRSIAFTESDPIGEKFHHCLTLLLESIKFLEAKEDDWRIDIRDITKLRKAHQKLSDFTWSLDDDLGVFEKGPIDGKPMEEAVNILFKYFDIYQRDIPPSERLNFKRAITIWSELYDPPAATVQLKIEPEVKTIANEYLRYKDDLVLSIRLINQDKMRLGLTLNDAEVLQKALDKLDEMISVYTITKALLPHPSKLLEVRDAIDTLKRY